MVEVKRKENESFESLLRRFNRKIQQSGVLVRARKIRFFEPPKSRNLQKVAARRRTVIKAQKEELKKLIGVYYAQRGWSATGIPKVETLKQIGLWNFLSDEAKTKVAAMNEK